MNNFHKRWLENKRILTNQCLLFKLCNRTSKTWQLHAKTYTLNALQEYKSGTLFSPSIPISSTVKVSYDIREQIPVWQVSNRYFQLKFSAEQRFLLWYTE